MSQSQSTQPGTNAALADYYALLGLPERYAIDAATFERNYLERSKQVHPDRFVNAPASERVAALQRSMNLNQAYKTLSDPVVRAEYLLRRNGLDIGDSETLDPAFLMEVLEAREELAEAKADRDGATLRRLEEQMLDRRDAALSEIARLFVENEGTDPQVRGDEVGERRLATIKKHVIVLRYIRRYLEEFDDLDDDEDLP